MRCPICGKEHPDDARYCKMTGQLIPKQTACTHCGEPVEGGWNVYPNCGSPLNAGKVDPLASTRKNFRWYWFGFVALLAFILVGSYWLQNTFSKKGLDITGKTESLKSTINPLNIHPTTTMSFTETPEGILLSKSTPYQYSPLPVNANTPLPPLVSIISADTAEQVVELARWGKGSIRDLTWSPDGGMLAVSSPLGIYLYDSQTLDEEVFFQTNNFGLIVGFSPDGKYLASADFYGNVKLWRVSDGSLSLTLEGGIYSDFSPDGAVWASRSQDNAIKIWRISDGELLHVLEGTADPVTRVFFSPDGTQLAMESYNLGIKLWRVSDWTPMPKLDGDTKGAVGVTFSPDGTLLASGSILKKTVQLWRASDGVLLHNLEGHKDYVYGVTFSPEGSLLASCSYDQTVKLWNVVDGKLLRTLEGVRSCVDFSTDGTLLISGSINGTMRLWRVQDGALLRTLGGVWSKVLSPNGMLLASLNSGSTIQLWGIASEIPRDTSIELPSAITQTPLNSTSSSQWVTTDLTSTNVTQILDHISVNSTQNMKELARLDLGHFLINGIGWTPDGKQLAVVFGNGVNLYDSKTLAGTGRFQIKGIQPRALCMTFSPDNLQIAIGSTENILIWRISDGVLLQTIDDSGVKLAYSLDRMTLASVNIFGHMKVWRVSDGVLLYKLLNVGHLAAFSPDGTILATGSADTIYLWRVSDGTLLHTLKGNMWEVNSLAFSWDGMLLASSSDNTLKIWRVADGTLIHTLDGHTETVDSVAFSLDGSLLASGAWDPIMRLWDTSDGTLVRTLEGHQGGINLLAFSPDGTMLASHSDDGTIRLWGIVP